MNLVSMHEQLFGSDSYDVASEDGSYGEEEGFDSPGFD